ncbi:DNA-binding transcriptional regulator, PadR family [Seinonella peptonophila]|uniref:DNA-binding transcriptional regulator, PadR family n=1 Tax=Seinonella peptonophila TaxID=112248 RepID=A0A1M4TZW0_9BACL|nr:PadR family transcriptional regulator [Seinonella peptonophila]SHE49933.1 DNA-binding transcriptional regulator, PadR family [Seinonella peptonophila]
MPKSKRSNLLALAVLSLLNESPMHPYEIGVTMKKRGISDTIKLNTGSLYAVIDHLLKNKMIRAKETLKEGKHPARTIYELTPAGYDEFFDWLRYLVQKPVKEYTQFAAGLAFLAHLSPHEAYELLRKRKSNLAEQIKTIRSSIDITQQSGVSRLFIIETEYELALLEAEKIWLEQIIRDISEGLLTIRKSDEWKWSK